MQIKNIFRPSHYIMKYENHIRPFCMCHIYDLLVELCNLQYNSGSQNKMEQGQETTNPHE